KFRNSIFSRKELSFECHFLTTRLGLQHSLRFFRNELALVARHSFKRNIFGCFKYRSDHTRWSFQFHFATALSQIFKRGLSLPPLFSQSFFFILSFKLLNILFLRSSL